jgi:phytoene synthase
MTVEAVLPSAPPVDRAAAMRLVDAKVREAGTSFFWAMRLLPRARREAMFAIYAFCREVDDIADDGGTQVERLAGLERWREEIAALYEGRASLPIAVALEEPLREFGFREADFLAVIDGMEMDARADIRAPSLAELDLYCDRVASATGRLSVCAFGVPDARGVRLAERLGRALQLTNILRDVAEDAGRGRLYLPRELLDRHGIAVDDPAAVLGHPALPAVCRDLAAIARDHFDGAAAALAECPRDKVRPAATMHALYGRLLDRLVAADWADPNEVVSVPTPTKLWLALRHGLL